MHIFELSLELTVRYSTVKREMQDLFYTDINLLENLDLWLG